MARSGNRTAAILTLFADGGKGAVAVALAAAVMPAAAAACGVLVVAGHITSPFLKFRGGRGVATALAVFLCWQPLLGCAVLAVWALVFALSRYSSLSSLAAVSAATLLFGLYAPAFFTAALIINGFIVVRHLDNLRRLAAGREQRFGK